MGAELSLGANEFDALDLLAMQEGEAVTFETLYKAVWKTEGSSNGHAVALTELENLISQVSEAGEGFMWIEHEPETGYRFCTSWGHNWRK